MDFAGSKFGRTCKLSLETQPDLFGLSNYIDIPDGLTIEFSINRQSLSSAQTAQFRIYGLAPGTRDSVYKDRFDLTQYRALQFSAGYQTFAPMIFNGQIFQAYSEKNREESVTIIDAFDGGPMISNGFSNTCIGGQVNPDTAEQMIKRLMATLPGVKGEPVVGKFPTTNMRGEVLCGNTWDLIRQKTSGNCAIVDGRPYALNTTEGLLNDTITDITTVSPNDATIPVISSDTGLIGAPKRSGILVEWDMLFEPRLRLFQIVNLQSKYNPRFSGPAKVMGFQHKGVVSRTVIGDYTTTASFIFARNMSYAQIAGVLTG